MLSAPHKQALDRLNYSIALTDAKLNVVFSNTALQEILAASGRYLAENSITQWLHCHGKELEASIQELQREQTSFVRLVAELALLKQVPLAVDLVLSCWDDGFLFEMLPHNTDARLNNAMEQQLDATAEQLRNLAHELGNPLGGIRAAAQLLAREQATPQVHDYTRIIVQEVDRLRELIRKMRIGYQQQANKTWVSIHQVCEYVLALLLAEYPVGIKIVRDYDVSLPDIFVDYEQLIQVLLNISKNATHVLAQQISDNTAEIIYRTRIARRVTIGQQRYKQVLMLQVIDNGPGVSPALQDKLFLPLISQTEALGSGLGLSICAALMRLQGGTIQYRTMPIGSTFQLLLPLS